MKIVFIGNCQAGALRLLYQRYVQPYTHDVVSHVASYENLTKADQERIAAADIVALQAQDFTAKVGALKLPENAQIHRFPVVSGAFLWPFSGRERPGNKAAPARPGGSYPGQLGDSWLNRLIRDGVSAEEATQRYLALDLSTVTDLDRLYRITLAKQRRMDEALGFDVATIIDTHFRDEPLFMTAYHPETRLVLHLAITLFRNMAVADPIIDRMARLQRDAALPASEAPIHPAVARHYGLRYVTPETTYRFHNEGSYRFEQWVHRYMEGTWNPVLATAIQATGRGDHTQATLDKLRQGLVESPTSGPGWAALARVLSRNGRPDEAIEAAQQAIQVDPAHAANHANLGAILFQCGRYAEAAEVLWRAFELDPAGRSVRRQLPLALMHAGQDQDALALVRDQIDDPLDPPNGEMLALYARLHHRVGDSHQALIWAERAADTLPVHPAALLTLADLLDQRGRHREAQFCLRQVLKLRPESAGALYSLSRSLQSSGDHDQAIDAMRQAITAEPSRWQFHAQLGRLLAAQARHPEAEEACQAALALNPSDGPTRNFLAALRADPSRREQAA